MNRGHVLTGRLVAPAVGPTACRSHAEANPFEGALALVVVAEKRDPVHRAAAAAVAAQRDREAATTNLGSREPSGPVLSGPRREWDGRGPDPEAAVASAHQVGHVHLRGPPQQ